MNAYGVYIGFKDRGIYGVRRYIYISGIKGMFSEKMSR